MVVLSKIYTRTGDAGTTALGSGDRVAKSHLRIHAYGTVDETNACLGLVRHPHRGREFAELDAMLARIQNDLFDLGADLCVPQSPDAAQAGLRIEQSQVERLEREIDQLNGDLEPLRSFVLPGGHPAAAALHLARTICRRAERLMVELAEAESGASRPRRCATSTGCPTISSSPPAGPTRKPAEMCYGYRARHAPERGCGSCCSCGCRSAYRPIGRSLGWFGFQFIAAVVPQDDIQIAWWAHIGGFATGFAVTWLFRAPLRRRLFA
jgi:cob(I)alamin adenosyltransferase